LAQRHQQRPRRSAADRIAHGVGDHRPVDRRDRQQERGARIGAVVRAQIRPGRVERQAVAVEHLIEQLGSG
jgi:hypothetical protein